MIYHHTFHDCSSKSWTSHASYLRTSAISLRSYQGELFRGVWDIPPLPQIQVNSGVIPWFKWAVPVQQARLLEEGLWVARIWTPACTNREPHSRAILFEDFSSVLPLLLTFGEHYWNSSVCECVSLPRCLTCHSGSSVVYLSWNTISMGGVATPPAMALLYMFCLRVERRKRVSGGFQADISSAPTVTYI